MGDLLYDPKQLNQILDAIGNIDKLQKKAENELLGLRISNAQRLYNLQIEQIKQKEALTIQREQAVNERLIKMGFNVAAVTSKQTLKERLAIIDAEEKEKLKGVSAEEEVRIKKEYADRRKQEEDLDKWRQKETEKADKKRFKDLKKVAAGTFDSLGDVLFKNAEEAIADLMAEGATEEEARKAVKAQKAQVVANEAAKFVTDFAKQLQSQINEIAEAQSQIDTRLQGSNNKSILGSYWKQMNFDIVRNVGMSPFVKQADVVNSLKTLVGKGIAFNVEQRAFLDTISAKIADTFEATDASLVKLVRIQQADTTAARLGMESALTAFLNNMYETTEYMTDAAASIRASIYEASALMGATEATAFEYQVQKWMGSLYSVGFGNTEGLAGALGKLASGDISGINNGGYGNLLLMAANRANLSIAEILAEGLDDSETNKLMQAMVEYLGEIYAETKDSKVVAQQFANVYGLTASDLKAAANLYGSTNNIAGNNLQYGGMIKRLQDMASTIYQRQSIGESMNNLIDNLKFATSSTIGNNPVLYGIYTVASMLDSVAGGISIPAFSVMGNMVDLETTVADLMRVGTVGAGLLGGIGTMLAGLGGGVGTAGMLRNFGISDSRIKTLTRGTGTGIAALAGASVSESGSIAGNADSSDVQNKTMGDAYESGDQQLAEAQDDTTETKLSTVDEHILQIYDLLQGVVDGTSSFHVDMGNSSAWADVLGGGKI